MTVRALFRVHQVDSAPNPYKHITMKVFYPSLDAITNVHRQSGILPFDDRWSPAPIVIFLPGVNCSPHTYEWLAVALAENGIVTIIPTWIAENLPGRVSITPGIDLDAVKAGNYGQKPTCSILGAIFEVIAEIEDAPVFAGHLKANSVILGGHSAGGTMALQNARRDWFPQVKAAFAYAANPLATSVLGGWEKGVVPPMPTDVPVLVLGASLDGIGDHHVREFGKTKETGEAFIRRIFDETAYHDSTMCIFEGANHHTICYPLDTTIGRIFMDTPTQADEQAIRQDMSQVIIDFIKGRVLGDGQAQTALATPPQTALHWKHSER